MLLTGVMRNLKKKKITRSMILFQFIFDTETGSYNSLEFTMRSSLPHRAPPSFPTSELCLEMGIAWSAIFGNGDGWESSQMETSLREKLDFQGKHYSLCVGKATKYLYSPFIQIIKLLFV